MHESLILDENINVLQCVDMLVVKRRARIGTLMLNDLQK